MRLNYVTGLSVLCNDCLEYMEIDGCKHRLLEFSTESRGPFKTRHYVPRGRHLKTKKNYAGTFDLSKWLKLVQLLTLSEKTFGFTCVIANPKPLFAP